MDNCLFCKIAAGEIPSRSPYSDEDVHAFYDLNPQAPTHILVVPKMHIPKHSELSQAHSEIITKLHLAAVKVAKEAKLDQGYRVVINNGPHGGQSVDHLHLHILGGRQMGWPPG
jgi:histidine triad (HIT) family protein